MSSAYRLYEVASFTFDNVCEYGIKPYFDDPRITFEIDSSYLFGLVGGRIAGVLTEVGGPMTPSTLLATSSVCPPNVLSLDCEPAPKSIGDRDPSDPVLNRLTDADDDAAPDGANDSVNRAPGSGAAAGPALMFAVGILARSSAMFCSNARSLGCFSVAEASVAIAGTRSGFGGNADASGLVTTILLPLSFDNDRDRLAVLGCRVGSLGGPSSFMV